MPTNTELARDLRSLDERTLALEAAQSGTVSVGTQPAGKRSFVESIVAAAVARDGVRCLESESGTEPRAVRAVVNARACVILALEALDDRSRLEHETNKRRAHAPVA